jgi:hypothetical protein
MHDSLKSFEASNVTKWKTYLLILVFSSAFSVIISLMFVDLASNGKYYNYPSFHIIMMLPNFILVLAWIYWIVIFLRPTSPRDINLMSNIHEEDLYYLRFRFKQRYWRFEIIISLYYVTLLVTATALISYLAQ